MIAYEICGDLCVLRLDSPPVNAISLGLLAELRSAVQRANGDRTVRAIMITGGPGQFSAGADLADFQAIRTGDDAVRMARTFQEAFQDIEDSAKPVIAAVAGNVLGGALELAMACHYRIAATGSRFGLPEIKLGINPGAGGTQRLPRLLGLPAALAMLLSGQAIDASRALSLGLIDAVCAGTAFLDEARTLPASGAPLRKTSQRTDKIQDAQANAAALTEAETTVRASRPEIIAPRTIVNAVRTGVEDSFAAGMRAEQEGFRQCMATLATQNKFHIFLATRQAAKIVALDGPAGPVLSRAAVIGMGTMGTGIVQALITAAVPVVAFDENPAALARGVEKIRSSLAGRVAQGKLTAGQAEEIVGRLTAATDQRQILGADLVIESVFEDVAVKQGALAKVQAICPPETVIASNTSTISLDELAQGLPHPDQLLGLHFFNPAQRMPLVEVIRRTSTPPGLVASLVAFARKIGKTPIVVKNREGFLVNRLFVPYLNEAFLLLEEGAEPAAIDRAMVKFGFAMGPLVLIDMAGLDILIFTAALLHKAFPRHGGPAASAFRLVERGHLGQKTGSGVYRYEQGSHQPQPNPVTAAICAEVRQERGLPLGPVSDETITRRLILRMVSEAFYVLEEGLCQRPSDLDVAMVLGTGLADFRGGPVKYAQDLGLERVQKELHALAAECGERFAPSRYLLNL